MIIDCIWLTRTWPPKLRLCIRLLEFRRATARSRRTYIIKACSSRTLTIRSTYLQPASVQFADGNSTEDQDKRQTTSKSPDYQIRENPMIFQCKTSWDHWVVCFRSTLKTQPSARHELNISDGWIQSTNDTKENCSTCTRFLTNSINIFTYFWTSWNKYA